MPITFTPATNTVVKTEFVGGPQTVNIVNVPNEIEFQILNVDGSVNPSAVAYSHPSGRVYPDMSVNWTTDSFTFASTYDYSFDRLTKYVYQPTKTSKEYYQVNSPHMLPPNDPTRPNLTSYTGIYQVSPPVSDLVTLTWSIQGRERTYTLIGGVPTAGAWTAKTYTWTMEVQYSFTYTSMAIKNAVKNGTGYKTALLTYPEIQL